MRVSLYILLLWTLNHFDMPGKFFTLTKIQAHLSGKSCIEVGLFKPHRIYSNKLSPNLITFFANSSMNYVNETFYPSIKCYIDWFCQTNFYYWIYSQRIEKRLHLRTCLENKFILIQFFNGLTTDKNHIYNV